MKKYLFIIDKRTWQTGQETDCFVQEFESDEAARTHAEGINSKEYGYNKQVIGLYVVGENLVS